MDSIATDICAKIAALPNGSIEKTKKQVEYIVGGHTSAKDKISALEMAELCKKICALPKAQLVEVEKYVNFEQRKDAQDKMFGDGKFENLSDLEKRFMGKDVWCFRGHTDSNWILESSLERYCREYFEISEPEKIENRLLTEFYRSIGAYVPQHGALKIPPPSPQPPLVTLATVLAPSISPLLNNA